jgi:hypothetical protein
LVKAQPCIDGSLFVLEKSHDLVSVHPILLSVLLGFPEQLASI